MTGYENKHLPLIWAVAGPRRGLEPIRVCVNVRTRHCRSEDSRSCVLRPRSGESVGVDIASSHHRIAYEGCRFCRGVGIRSVGRRNCARQSECFRGGHRTR